MTKQVYFLKSLTLAALVCAFAACKSGSGSSVGTDASSDPAQLSPAPGSPPEFHFGNSPGANDGIEPSPSRTGIGLSTTAATVGGGGVGSPSAGLSGQEKTISDLPEVDAIALMFNLPPGRLVPNVTNVIQCIVDGSCGRPNTDLEDVYLGKTAEYSAGLATCQSFQDYKAAMRFAFAERPYCLAKLVSNPAVFSKSLRPVSVFTSEGVELADLQILKSIFYQGDHDRVVSISFVSNDELNNLKVVLRIPALVKDPRIPKAYLADGISCFPNTAVPESFLKMAYSPTRNQFSYGIHWKRETSDVVRSTNRRLIDQTDASLVDSPLAFKGGKYVVSGPTTLNVGQRIQNLTYDAFTQSDDLSLILYQLASIKVLPGTGLMEFRSHSKILRPDPSGRVNETLGVAKTYLTGESVGGRLTEKYLPAFSNVVKQTFSVEAPLPAISSQQFTVNALQTVEEMQEPNSTRLVVKSIASPQLKYMEAEMVEQNDVFGRDPQYDERFQNPFPCKVRKMDWALGTEFVDVRFDLTKASETLEAYCPTSGISAQIDNYCTKEGGYIPSAQRPLVLNRLLSNGMTESLGGSAGGSTGDGTGIPGGGGRH